ncbi:DUF7373 family lipoprotein [Geodermatophilus sp. URMC 64]
MTRRRLSSRPGTAGRLLAGALLCAVPLLTGCSRSVAGEATAAPGAPVPTSPQELAELVVTDVPSGLPRLPDDALTPPAGAKWVSDVAAYARDPHRERDVLADYGFRFGWERFWGTGAESGPVTGVFVYQFRDRAGAGAYAREVAGNEAEFYRGMLRDDPPGLPGGCRLLTVDRPAEGLPGPAAMAWCGSGVFGVSVTSVADSPSAAADEVAAVLRAQLERLPPS